MGAHQILIVRHGETAHNARRILQPPEVPLSERGLEQARLLAERLAGLRVGRILSSDLARAAMTARAIERGTGAELRFDPLLQERSFGDLRGTPYADLAENPFAPGYHPPGGESEEVFLERVRGAWQQVLHHARETEGALAVVTHGLVCRAFVAHHLDGAPPDEPPTWPNTCLTIAEGPAPWRLTLLACATHLDTLPDSAPA